MRGAENRWKNAIWPTLLAITLLGLFAYSVKQRWAYFGVATGDRFYYVSAHTVTIAKNWLHDGPLALRFGMMFNPPSVEMPTIADRELYISYPPFHVVPVYLLSLATGKAPDAAIVMAVVLLVHFVVAASVCYIAYITAFALCRRQTHALASAIAAASLVLFTPCVMYWLQNVYFSDQWVLLPAALAMALEVARSRARHRLGLEIALAVVALTGCLTDYLMFTVVAAILIKRFLLGELGRGPVAWVKNAAPLIGAATLAVGLFALQLTLLDGWKVLAERAALRTGLSTKGQASLNYSAGGHVWLFWVPRIRDHYGQFLFYCLTLGGVLIVVALGGYLIRRFILRRNVRREIKLALGAGFVAYFACFLQVFGLREHSIIHDWAWAKFIIPLSISIAVIMPASLVLVIRGLERWVPFTRSSRFLTNQLSARRGHALALLIASFALIALTYLNNTGLERYFDQPPVKNVEIAEFVGRNTEFVDIVISPDHETGTIPPQELSISEKRVYRVTDPDDAIRVMAKLREKCRENPRWDLLFIGEPDAKWAAWLVGAQVITDGRMRLYRGIDGARQADRS